MNVQLMQIYRPILPYLDAKKAWGYTLASTELGIRRVELLFIQWHNTRRLPRLIGNLLLTLPVVREIPQIRHSIRQWTTSSSNLMRSSTSSSRRDGIVAIGEWVAICEDGPVIRWGDCNITC